MLGIVGGSLLLLLAGLLVMNRRGDGLAFYYYVFLYHMGFIVTSIAVVLRALFMEWRYGKDSSQAKRYRTDMTYDACQFYRHYFIPPLGVKFEVEGEEHLKENPVIYLLNHQSSFDVVCFGHLSPRNTVVIGKKSLKYVPGFGRLLEMSGCIFVDRANHEDAMIQIDRAGKEIVERKINVLVFPEGTRSREGDSLLPFKKGAFNIAVSAQVPIVPIIIGDQKHIYYSKLRLFRSGTLKIRVLPPIPTKGLTRTNVPELCDRVRNIMIEEIKALNAEQQPSSEPVSQKKNN